MLDYIGSPLQLLVIVLLFTRKLDKVCEHSDLRLFESMIHYDYEYHYSYCLDCGDMIAECKIHWLRVESLQVLILFELVMLLLCLV